MKQVTPCTINITLRMHKSNLTNEFTIEIKNFPTRIIKIEIELKFNN